MRSATQFILFCVVMIIAGCASRARPADAVATSSPATAPSDPRAMLSLEQIEPTPAFAQPATAPTGQAPLAALDLFARARDARARNQPFTAINLLEQAIKLDPQSFELYHALGGAYQRVGNFDKAIDAYQRAAAIEPDDLVLQAELGRAYMQRGDASSGIRHLRLARMTDEYGSDEALAAAVDYRLGVALQQVGYDRAALEMYNRVLKRLQSPSGALRSNPEIAYLLNRPEFLIEQLGRLYEKHGQWDHALQAYELIAQRQPDDFSAQARVVNTLLAMGRTEDAMRGAGELVVRFKASSDSLTLLRQVYSRAGRGDAAVEQLRQLREQHPHDRTILFALADALDSTGQGQEAEELLNRAAEQRNGDVEVFSRLVRLKVRHGNLDGAAHVLIESAARRPQTTSELLPLWTRLVSPGRKPTLHPDDVQKLLVAPDARAAQLYFASRVAQAWNRPSAAEAALRQSVAARPLFAPAFRARADDIWTEVGFDDKHKEQEADELIAAAGAAGDQPLALELTGMSLLAQKKFGEAQKTLSEAIRLGGNSPELALSEARAFRGSGNAQRFQQLGWKIISDHPRFAPAYAELFRHHSERGNFNAARKVLENWLTNMPEDVDARLLEATVELRFNRRPDQAERILLQLFNEYPDRLDVLVNLRVYCTETGKLSTFIEMLELQCTAHPYNFPGVAQLVDIYISQQRLPDAARVIDAARAALRDDPDRLYFIAHLYSRIEQPALNEQVLEEVLRADPSYASAANDLGYTWADSGRNLDRAEALIRRAVESEPNNAMFLDSLGWVMYKRGRFDEARRHLEQAVAHSRPADPVVLDHLGDVLYRLNDTDAAAQQWQLSLQRIQSDPQPQQHNALKLQLDQKLKQVELKQPASVAPVVESLPAPVQAKN